MSSKPDTPPDSPSADPVESQAEDNVDKVLLAVTSPGNRKQLMNILESHFRVESVTDVPDSMPEFDLTIIDVEGLKKWRTALVGAKQRVEPTLLPVMLVLAKNSLRQRIQADSEVIDEFVVTPTNPLELVERARILLRARRMSLKQSDHLAYTINHDSVTGLANRPLFEDRVDIALRGASREDDKMFLVVVRLAMRSITESLGNMGMEAAARELSSWLRSCFGDDIEPARLSTGDWGIMLPLGTSFETMMTLARKINDLREAPLRIGEEEIRLRPKVGVGIWPDDSDDAVGLINAATAAAGQANGDGEPTMYSRTAQEQAVWHFRTENELSKGLDDGELELWFQPQLRLADQVVIGAEALVRWRRPSGLMVSPAEFIPIAEKSDLILKITRWVLEQAFRVLSEWRERQPDFIIAINITPADVARPNFVELLTELWSRHRVPPENLKFELTETMFGEVTGVLLDRLRELRDKGPRIAIDDFGTGYSSLSYLHHLPVDVLKIDKSFIDRIPDDEDGVGIVEAIIVLARHFHMDLVAEGVEHKSQADFLQSQGVDTAQGYYFAKPMPASEFVRWMKW
ncbi:MAG: putative bifunctional diguanylate cyclase/phosphodiesterase [Pseudomonadota bacterium]